MENVTVQIVLKELSYKSVNDTNWTSLYFDYKVINNSQEQIYFRFDSLKVKCNESISSGIYNNSVASVIPTNQNLKLGENNFSLYAVFSDSLVLKTQNDFRIISYGILQ